jgi:hypothetical protein
MSLSISEARPRWLLAGAIVVFSQGAAIKPTPTQAHEEKTK